MKDISLYIHIPFCKSKCNYCDFLSFDNKDSVIKEYVNALINEIKNYSDFAKDSNVKSIFIGGGTPSILSCPDIEKIFDTLKSYYNIDRDAEITIEANPGTLDEEKIKVLLSSDVNRISMGLQSCNNGLLKKLGRIHTWEEFLNNYNMIRNSGFDNINIDLMFALPNQTISDIENDLKKIISLRPEHISYYSLIIEEGTKFSRLYDDNKLVLPAEDVERDMYWLIHDTLQDNGYKHYEISNYALDNRECYHNKVYWKEEEYIGMGLGASSYFEGFRYKNINNLSNYIDINGDISKLKESTEKISKKTSIEEYMFLGLRLLEGIDKIDFYNRWGHEIEYYYKDVIQELIEKGLIIEDGCRLRLTKKGIDVSNFALSMFLFD
ncbi:radical SAM family heme chaperone HemW [Vallitalea guaymasensis]|uniref:Heme chaperone HemW n=1 Tax=Vallitalea guaymasensis TaxID=1185412 RepID=A0A8J8SDY3_9FIRM|nr:radical SAM family heme chaperone HemW [Vallitalea guaymasensis]QUH31000.1 oxygen-independent coproporphyrinogen III oxidase [Vallitalea guaymasensis]